MSDHDIRMLKYEKEEQEFLQFINQSRRNRDTPITPDAEGKHLLSEPTRGLICLKTLARLLEERAMMKQSVTNIEKDSESLVELRKQAERMVII